MKRSRATADPSIALSHELDPVGMVRFLQQFETGTGDYTAERRQWLGEATVEDLVREIEQGRKAPENVGSRE